jgi:hypothetical protein
LTGAITQHFARKLFLHSLEELCAKRID